MTSFLKYVALTAAFTSASAIKSLLPHMDLDGYLADRFPLMPEVLSNFHFSDSCYRFDRLSDNDNRNSTPACETKKTDLWSIKTETEYIPQLSMRAAINILPPPEVGDECKGERYCENVINYNEYLAFTLLEQNQGRDETLALTLNIKPDSNEKHDGCGASPVYYRPKAVSDENGQWFYILNPKDHEFQKVFVNKCLSTECTMSDFLVKCSPVKTSLTFTIINSQSEIEKKTFNEMPIDCSCNQYA